MLQWLFLDLNSYFASCEQQDNPAWRGKPLIVTPGMMDSTCAIAASLPAKKLGIKTGTKVYDAKRLCPNIIITPARHRRYVEYHERIVAAVDKIRPVEKIMSIDEMAVRLTGRDVLPIEAEKLAYAIKAQLRHEVGECLTCSIGIASSLLLAKTASDMQKPDGLVLLPSDALPGRLLELQLRDLPGIGPAMEARLLRGGIMNMQQLWHAPPEQLRSIWGGVEGLRFHSALHGVDPIRPSSERRSFSHQHVLEPALRTIAGATEISRQLLSKGVERMRRDGWCAGMLGLQLKWLGGKGYWGGEEKLPATNDTRHFLAALGRLWRRVPAQGGVLRVGIYLGQLARPENCQGDLFAPPDKRQLSAAVDGLNQRYGRGTVHFGLSPQLSQKARLNKIAFQRVPDAWEV